MSINVEDKILNHEERIVKLEGDFGNMDKDIREIKMDIKDQRKDDSAIKESLMEIRHSMEINAVNDTVFKEKFAEFLQENKNMWDDLRSKQEAERTAREQALIQREEERRKTTKDLIISWIKTYLPYVFMIVGGYLLAQIK